MAILKIARMGHPVLGRVADPVADPTAPEIRQLVRDMVEFLDALQLDAVHYVGNPEGICQSTQRQVVEELKRLNGMLEEERIDPEIQTRITQSEMAFRMQSSVPELTSTWPAIPLLVPNIDRKAGVV